MKTLITIEVENEIGNPFIEICPLDNSSKDIIVASVLSDGWWWRKDTGHRVNPHAFSHWMPLPLSPKDSIRKNKEK